jgi:hypothetical protein
MIVDKEDLAAAVAEEERRVLDLPQFFKGIQAPLHRRSSRSRLTGQRARRSRAANGATTSPA